MAEVRTTSSSGGQKGVKPQAYNLIPAEPLTQLAQLYGLGARKYANRNYEKGYEYSKSFASMQRHINLFWSGESIDVEMNMNHVVNVAWHAIALYSFSLMYGQFDDRVRVYDPVKPQHEPDFRVKVDTEYPVKHVDDYADVRGEDAEPRFDLIPQRALAALAELYGSGRVVPVGAEGRVWSDVYCRLQEHAFKFWAGHNYDEHGVHHMTYALAYALDLITLFDHFPEYDDRYTVEHGALPMPFTSAPEKK